MQRTRVVLIATLVVLALPATAEASHGDGGGSKHDFATGSFRNALPVTGGPLQGSFAAHSDPFGADVSGYFRGSGDVDGPAPLDSGFTVQGHMTCLEVEGNRAAFRYRFERNTGSTEPFEGGGIQIFVEDNGPPKGGTPLDAMAFDAPEPPGLFDLHATLCDDPESRVYDPIDAGDIVVHDAAG
jgi:hypothetical protein